MCNSGRVGPACGCSRSGRSTCLGWRSSHDDGSCHWISSWGAKRSEGVTRRLRAYLCSYLGGTLNGGTIEKAQQIAAHESPKTTKLYDRTSDQVTLDEIERIAI
jgi:hypothetical protein